MQKVNLKTPEELQKTILREKAKGTSDLEIGQKYGVTFRYIERLITKSQGVNVSALKVSKKVKSLYPKVFKEEQTTVWSFKQRGNWATHSGEYRGNWSPYIPRNVILKYSKPGEIVLDYFCGAGTTAVECKLLGRKCRALDINDKAIELAKKNMNFNTSIDKKEYLQIYEPELLVRDARDLFFLQDNSVDLICAHPPYANILHYTDSKEGDLSFFEIDDFLKEMVTVAKESYRVLKPARQCAILIGDMRKKKHVIPMGFRLIDIYLKAGFKLKELVIKRQHNCKSTGFWYTNSIKYNFLLLAHEYLPIFEKPRVESTQMIKEPTPVYETLLPYMEEVKFKNKFSELETTTVWIFPENEFQKQLEKNVLERYSRDKKFTTITLLSSQSRSETSLLQKEKKHVNLLFLKSPCLEIKSMGYNEIRLYLNSIKEIIQNNINSIIKGGTCVIQTKDVRINGYIEPLADDILKTLEMQEIAIKEIIVVTGNRHNNSDVQQNAIQRNNNNLVITHQYLLIYEKVV